MSLLPNAGPPLPITHKMLDPSLLGRLKDQLRERAGDGRVTLEMIEAVAQANDQPLENAYAAMALDPNLVFEVSNQTLLAICVGGCQAQGAVPLLGKLLASRAERINTGKASFDVIPRHCLDMCSHSPVCLSRGAHGQAAHPRLKEEQIPELVAALCD